MSEMYKKRKKVLIRGAGDLATGVGVALHRAGFRVIMTEIAVPLTVRREVAMSRAVYEGRIEVEGIEGILVENYQEARRVLAADKIAVIVDPEAEIRREFRPDVLVDAILAKRNTGTSRVDAPYVIGLGPGFIAGKDVHAVIETMRGLTLADIIYDGQPIPNTGIPGYVGGYALERLIRASAAGRMEPKAQIGDVVRKGQLLALTGGKPVYSQLDGVIRGMLQEGVQVKKGLKIGDVDPRKDKKLCYLISDKANEIGSSVVKTVEARLSDKDYAMILLAAGKSSRYGNNKLLEKLDGGQMFEHTLRKMRAFPLCTQVVVTRFEEIENAAKTQGMLVVQNTEPELGIAHSLKLGLKRALDENPGLKGAMFIVCDQPGQQGLDATLGYGGHTSKMLEKLQGEGHIYGLDVDPIESAKTKKRLEEKGFGSDILTVKLENFANIDKVAKEAGKFDFVLADLGVSSMQIDNPDRGFTFKAEGPLDLRMNPEKGISAAERLHDISREELAGMLVENADEPYAEEIAEAVTEKIRKGGRIETTTGLHQVIGEALAFIPEKERKEAIRKSSQRVFQALRIDVNHEFEVLYDFLDKLPGVLKPGGKVAILTFHSGEDRLVKKSFKQWKKEGLYSEIAKDVIRPSKKECFRNSRAKCTKMRWAIRSEE